MQGQLPEGVTAAKQGNLIADEQQIMHKAHAQLDREAGGMKQLPSSQQAPVTQQAHGTQPASINPSAPIKQPAPADQQAPKNQPASIHRSAPVKQPAPGNQQAPINQPTSMHHPTTTSQQVFSPEHTHVGSLLEDRQGPGAAVVTRQPEAYTSGRQQVTQLEAHGAGKQQAIQPEAYAGGRPQAMHPELHVPGRQQDKQPAAYGAGKQQAVQKEPYGAGEQKAINQEAYAPGRPQTMHTAAHVIGRQQAMQPEAYVSGRQQANPMPSNDQGQEEDGLLPQDSTSSVYTSFVHPDRATSAELMAAEDPIPWNHYDNRSFRHDQASVLDSVAEHGTPSKAAHLQQGRDASHFGADASQHEQLNDMALQGQSANNRPSKKHRQNRFMQCISCGAVQSESAA